MTSQDQNSALSAARLGAVQALYQLTMDQDVAAPMVVEQFTSFRLGKEMDGDQLLAADNDHFADVVQGVAARKPELDGLINATLSDDWKPERLENIMRAILRAGVYELVGRPDIPTAVIIDEYVDIAHAFYGDKEPGFVNGILDKIGKQQRS